MIRLFTKYGNQYQFIKTMIIHQGMNITNPQIPKS